MIGNVPTALFGQLLVPDKLALRVERGVLDTPFFSAWKVSRSQLMKQNTDLCQGEIKGTIKLDPYFRDRAGLYRDFGPPIIVVYID